MGVRSFGWVALAGCIACSSGGSSGAGGSGATGGGGGSGGSSADAAPSDAGEDVDAAAEQVLFEKLCSSKENQLLIPRTLTELAFAQPFVRLAPEDNGECCYQGMGPTHLAEGSVALASCLPVGAVSIAGNRTVVWYVPKAPAFETFAEPCSASYYVGEQMLTFAEHAFPGKSSAELSAVRVIVHQDTPTYVYTTNKGDTEYFDKRPEQIFVRDGSVAVSCTPDQTITFVLPSQVSTPGIADVPCDPDVAVHEYPGATLSLLTAVRAIRHGLGAAGVGTTPSASDVYQADIADRESHIDDGSWTKKTPYVHVACEVVNTSTAIAGPITFVSW